MRRLDDELRARGLFPSREDAERAILAGEVSGRGGPLTSPGRPTTPNEPLSVRERPRFVSRGGLKLEAALEAFGVNVRGWRCADLGASTGGFTDCLLQHGAASVLAVDVGYGQFHWRLRNDGRVTLRERTNARSLLGQGDLKGRFDLVASDLSFVSATKIVPTVTWLLRPGGLWVCLVKPQFEARRADVGEGGVVRSDAVRAQAIERVERAARAGGLADLETVPSPVMGAKGNVEFLLCAKRPPSP